MYKKITLDEWVRSGEGGNAISYDHIKDRSVLLKLAKADKRAIEDMKGEIDLAYKAMALCIDTPKVLDKVECDGRIGLIYKKLQDKKSIGRLCHDDPLHTRQYAKDFARETVKIHSIKCADKGLKNYKDFYIEELLTGTQDKIYTKKVIDLINDEIEDKDTFIHGDLTVGNIIYSDNKWYWIDLGRMGHGDPLFDLADAYFTFKFLSSLDYVRNLFHMTKSQMIEFFDNFIKEYAYLSSQDCDRLCDRIKRVSVIYAFRMWAKVIKHVPILYQVLHYKAKKYYDDVIGK